MSLYLIFDRQVALMSVSGTALVHLFEYAQTAQVSAQLEVFTCRNPLLPLLILLCRSGAVTIWLCLCSLFESGRPSFLRSLL
jgi:hypothetical protein